MMNDVENEVKEQQAEDGLVNRVPELKQLSEDIDKATNTFINAALELESAIQQYQRAEAKLGGAVTTISKKVDTPPNMACGIQRVILLCELRQNIKVCTFITSIVATL